jgi:bifunctional non-homologous end joining protein LigD
MGRGDRLRGPEMFQPMLASPGKEVPDGDEWVFEPKYDGIRIIALVTADAVALITRNGHDKCRQFPEVSARLIDLRRALGRNLVLDGEVVALDADGEPARFQDLQGRMHLTDDVAVEQLSSESPASYIAFDILIDGTELLVDLAWDQRRQRLERVGRGLSAAMKRVIRVSQVSDGSGPMLKDARAHGWEGIMAKRRDCPYEPGRRVRHWRKVKLEHQQEFVVGGWTEPRNSRKHFGALLLGYYDDAGRLVYAGHTGTGFSDRVLDDVYRKIKAGERATSPFATTPMTNEAAHWTAPRYVAEIRFNEWTGSGVLRQPVFVGLRDDKSPRAVVREPPPARIAAAGVKKPAKRSVKAATKTPARAKPAKKPATKRASKASGSGSASAVAEQLRANAAAKNVEIQIDGQKLAVTNLGKIFFPVAKVTKGRLMEYYAEVAPYLLPALEDRPLVLKRYPNGIKDEAFYQQKAPDKVPAGVRVESVADEGITTQRRLIGDNLLTLLYLVQLGAVSTDPWHSRVETIGDADYSIIDLDPGPDATFKRVVQVAQWVKEELDELGLHAVPKTSGASGIHIVMPLPRGASYEVSRTLAELVARRVAEKRPKETTVHRWVKSRPPAAVYVDYLQNIRGKTVASVYSCRAETHASCSTPLKWNEITLDLDPRDFTVDTLPKRLKRVGDLWALGMRKTNRLPGIVGDAAA